MASIMHFDAFREVFREACVIIWASFTLQNIDCVQIHGVPSRSSKHIQNCWPAAALRALARQSSLSLRFERRLVPEEGLEPSSLAARDFESRVYTDSTTPARLVNQVYPFFPPAATRVIMLYFRL